MPAPGKLVGKGDPAHPNRADRYEEFSEIGIDPPENQGHFTSSYASRLNIPASEAGIGGDEFEACLMQ